MENKCIITGKSKMVQEQVPGDPTHGECPRGGTRWPTVALETGVITGRFTFGTFKSNFGF